MAVHFILGGSGRGKSYYLNHMISERAQQEPERQFIMLVPEQFTMQTQREMVRISPNQGIMNIDVQSFVRLAYRIFGETGMGSLPVLDDMGKTMILRKVLSDCQDRLVYFGRNVHKRGYVAEIKSFLSELLQYGINDAKLQEMIEESQDHPVLQKKLQDMSVAYEAFQTYLKDHYITSEEVLSVLCDAVPESKILRDSVICLDGFTGFTPIQYRLIEQLMLCTCDLYVTVTISPEEPLLKVGPKHRLFYLSRKTMDKLRHLASEHHIEVCPEIWTGTNKAETRFHQADSLDHLEKNLFRYPNQLYQEEPQEISLHMLKQPEQEISFVIQEILSLRQKGIRYRDIAIVTGDMEVYGLLAPEPFARAGLPCFIDQKKSILTHPFVETLRALVDILITDFAYEPLMRFLRSRYSPLDREDVDILDNFLLASGIRGHRKWEKTWQCAYAFSIREEEQQKEADQRLNHIRQRIWELLGGLYERLGTGRHPVSHYARELTLFMEEQDYYQALYQDTEGFRQLGNADAAGEYSQVYQIVLDVLDRLVELLGEESLPLRDFSELLDTGFSEARVGLIPPGVDQLLLGDISRTRLADIKYLFFLGVNDCNIPKGSNGGGVLSEAERSFLEQADYELAPTNREAVFTEQFYLYLNLTKPQCHLYICFCETGNDGKAQNPAYLIDRLRGLFPKLESIVEQQRQDEEHILGDDLGMTYLIQGLRSGDYSNSRWQELFRYYWGESSRRKQLQPLLEAAFYRAGDTSLSQAAAKALYDSVLRGSASQLERYAACGYAYFLQYGLRLNQRAEHAVEFFDIGNVVHEALESYTEKLLQEGRQWQELSPEQQQLRADQCLEQVTAGYKNGLLHDTHRDTHLIARLRRILHRTIWAITKQMEQGQFQTVDSELGFAQLHGPLNLVGRVDRVDRMETEEADYITIIDYKTGKKDISLSDLYYGLQMQLIIYLQAAVQQEEKQKKKLVIPAGVFYYNIEDPLLDTSIQETEREKALLTALRLQGLINENDPVLPSVDRQFATDSGALPASTASIVAPFETDKNGMLKKKSSAITTKDFELLMAYSRRKLQEMSQEILDGKIPMEPYRRLDSTGATACDYCPYHSVCQFDLRLPGHSYRSIKKMSSDDALLAIQREEKITFL